ncbi:type II toxin-antitoxin system RelE/ParE family toxin [Sulfuricaulis sp.]|uniref:type II toxin-antitoxin system RelE/ParE family toxin n=1 Tax=Sulfuricaulis sp. TaxID=2003553 RepID=UPI0034A51178
MTLEVRLRPEAEQDLADAATWYEEQRQGLGHEFLDEVLTMLTSIAETPLMYPDVHRNTRRAVIHRFPFSVYFRLEDATIVVIAVMHGSRNPRRWKSGA